MSNLNIFENLCIYWTCLVGAAPSTAHKFKAATAHQITYSKFHIFCLLRPPHLKENYLRLNEFTLCVQFKCHYYIGEDVIDMFLEVIFKSEEPACVLMRVCYQVENSFSGWLCVWNVFPRLEIKLNASTLIVYDLFLILVFIL